MLLYFCQVLFHMFKFLIINNIPLLNTLSILNIPNVSVFLRPIACFNSGTKFILLIDSAFFLSIKCLCGFHKPKKLLKPIDLQDHFEVFVCSGFIFSFFCVPTPSLYVWVLPWSTCLRPWPRARPYIIIQPSFPLRCAQPHSQPTGNFMRLLVAPLCLTLPWFRTSCGGQ